MELLVFPLRLSWLPQYFLHQWIPALSIELLQYKTYIILLLPQVSGSLFLSGPESSWHMMLNALSLSTEYDILPEKSGEMSGMHAMVEFNRTVLWLEINFLNVNKSWKKREEGNDLCSWEVLKRDLT